MRLPRESPWTRERSATTPRTFYQNSGLSSAVWSQRFDHFSIVWKSARTRDRTSHDRKTWKFWPASASTASRRRSSSCWAPPDPAPRHRLRRPASRWRRISRRTWPTLWSTFRLTFIEIFSSICFGVFWIFSRYFLLFTTTWNTSPFGRLIDHWIDLIDWLIDCSLMECY